MTRFKFRPAHFALVATLLAALLRFYHLSSLAPEAWFDEVWYALRAREMIAAPQWVVFFETAWGGSNALSVYLTALAQLLGFTGISSSRIPAAALGVIAVPLGYACFNELLRSEWPGRQRRWIAALAAFVLAYLLFWVIVSRVGMEPSLAPAAALFCVWQLKKAEGNSPQRAQSTLRKNTMDSALSANSAVNYALAGVAAGIAQYSGPHARFILPLLAFIAIHDLLRCPAPLRPRLITGFAIAALSGLVVVTPLALFFIREPEWFVARARITTGITLSNPKLLLNNLRLILISFNFVGSFDPLTNYPGLPIFDPIQSVGFFVGHGWALWNVRKSAAARELLAWEAVMIAPSLFTGDAPNFQRMIGFGAPASAIIAVGWLLLIEALPTLAEIELQRREGRQVFSIPLRPWRLRGSVFGIWFLGFGIFFSLLYQSFTLFVRYPRLSILPISYTATPVNTARELIARSEAGERVFVSRNREDDDVIAFEFLFPGTAVERLDLRQCLPWSDDRASPSSYLVLTKRDKQSVIALHEAYPTARITESFFWQDSGTLIEVPAGTRAPAPPHPGRARFEPGLRLVGYDGSSSEIRAGQSLFITLHWKAETDITTDYTSFIHIGAGLDDTAIVAQRDGQPCQGLFPTSHWRAGDLVRDSFAVTLPPDTPPGDYPLAIGWYTFPDLQRLSLREADAPLPDNRAIIGVITVTP